MTDATIQKFGIVGSETKDVEFEFEAEQLGFSSLSPAGFVWNEAKSVPPEFMDAGVFSSLVQEHIGYDPLNRDRFEIRLYSAKIFPARVALGTGYASLLASQWGKMNFGIQVHSPEFGEVLGGDNSSGVMMVNRISVIRRGENVLIVRSKFDSKYFDKYSNEIASFVGSIKFNVSAFEDPVKDNFKATSLYPNDIGLTFDYSMPGNWESLGLSQSNPLDGQAAAWVDVDDPNRNSGALVLVSKAGEPAEQGAKPKFDEQAMANLSSVVLGVMLDNLLPGQAYKFEPKEMNGFGNLAEVSAFNKMYTYKVIVGSDEIPVVANILMTFGRDGVAIITSTFSAAGGGQYLFGTRNHTSFVQELLLSAQYAHWKSKHEN
ncbi:hypothetical protein [Roseibium sediminis]|uniref:hypothetical protein n=1 Tax=Roseibium sediminis TaxID=1775174 RepID=UPI00123E23AB|nr:hypothetical protein [Roseibium sediminis]